MCNINGLQEKIKVIAVFLVCLTLITGISYIVHGGDLEAGLVLIVINLSITGILFYGAKAKDTVHIFVWLVFGILQIVGLIIGMCYFAYTSELLLDNYKKLKTEETRNSVWESRIVCIVYSVICFILAIILVIICIVVKKFYDELKRHQPFRPQGK